MLAKPERKPLPGGTNIKRNSIGFRVVLAK